MLFETKMVKIHVNTLHVFNQNDLKCLLSEHFFNIIWKNKTIPKFEMPMIKIVDFTSVQS